MKTKQKISYWKHVLKIPHWDIVTEKIKPFAVYDEEKTAPGAEFIGVEVSKNINWACIYHTRKLKHEDIIHELLHIAYPCWSEEKVNKFTRMYLKTQRGL